MDFENKLSKEAYSDWHPDQEIKKENKLAQAESVFKEIGKEQLDRSVEEIYQLSPELKSIGTPEQYEQYMNSIFPESVLHNIVMWHGTPKDLETAGKIYISGFSTEGNISIEKGKEFYGFFFGDRFSHLGGPGMDSIPVILNIRNPRLIDKDKEIRLSGQDLTKGPTATYNLTNEDGLIQLGDKYFHANNNISSEEFRNYEEGINRRLERFVLEDLSQQDVIDYSQQHAVAGLPLDEIVVFKPEQIHILGSQKDIESFKNFLDTKASD